jgi:hypothetical protein
VRNYFAVSDENNIPKAELFGLYLFGFGYFQMFAILHGPEVGGSCKVPHFSSEICGFGRED